MPLNEDIVDIEKRHGICSLTFVPDEFSGLFLNKIICINNGWCFIRFLVLIKL